MPASPKTPDEPLREERRRHIRGLVWIAAAILLFSLSRAGWHHVFPPGWWRLW